MKKWFKRIGIGLGVFLLLVVVVWGTLFIFPLAAPERMPYLEGDDQTLVIAHRGGLDHAPEGTLEAFRYADEIGADVLEYDVHITSDKELVVIHDYTVDRTTDGAGRVNHMTLEEVQALDAGYNYTNEDGEYSFRDHGVYIPTVAEVFEEFGHTRHLIELKASNDPDLYEDLFQEMWALIEEHDLHDKVLIASFDHEMNERFNEIAGGTVAIGAGEQEARRFVVHHKALANLLYDPSAHALQLPMEQEGFNMADWKLIRGANNRGMAIYYWTINDEDTMRELIELDAHGIMTDNPKRLIDILSEEVQE